MVVVDKRLPTKEERSRGRKGSELNKAEGSRKFFSVLVLTVFGSTTEALIRSWCLACSQKSK